MSGAADSVAKVAVVAVLWAVAALATGGATKASGGAQPSADPVEFSQDNSAQETALSEGASVHGEAMFQLTAEQAESVVDVQLSCPLAGHQPQLWVERVVNPHRQAFLLSLYAEPVDHAGDDRVAVGRFSLFPSDRPGRFLLDVRSLETAVCSRAPSRHLRLRLRMDGLHGALVPPLAVRAKVVLQPCGAAPPPDP